MSNSDDDWFEKDINDFVVQVPPSNVEHITTSKILDADNSGWLFILEYNLTSQIFSLYLIKKLHTKFQNTVEATVIMKRLLHLVIKVKKRILQNGTASIHHTFSQCHSKN